MNLTDSDLGEIERLGNCAIHELVFALQHAEQGTGDDALTCIVQVQQNCEAMADKILAQLKADGEA